jgi:methyl-accepting chemotaxis protein
MLSNMTIRAKLFLIIGLMSLLALTLDAVGILGIKFSNSSLQSVYLDRFIPTQNLTEIESRQYLSRLCIVNSVIFPQESTKNIEIIKENSKVIDEMWDAYTHSYGELTQEERKLADKFEADRKMYREQALLPALKLIEMRENANLEKLIIEKVRPLFSQLENDTNDLVQLQKAMSNMAYESSQQTYNSILIGSVLTLLFGLSFCVYIGIYIARHIVNALNDAKAIANAIAQGDLSSRIETGAVNEIGEMLNAMKMMQQTIIGIVEAQDEIAKKHREGWIHERMDASKFPGIYKTMIQTLNDMVGSHVAVKMRAVEIISQYAKGDFTADIENLPGDKAKVSNAIINMKSCLLAINNEIKSLVAASVHGDFSKRSRASEFEFMFKEILLDIDTLVRTCESAFDDTVRVTEALANGDLTKKVTKEYSGTFGKVKDGLNSTVDSLKNLISEIKETSDIVASTAKEIASGNNDLSHRTEQQAASLEETASSMHELTSTVQHNSENAKQASELADGATQTANKGVEVIDQVVNTMENINQSSLRIVDIISVIDDIAFQTNILALNAAVEAARAGEQGKGFAVVATEVRNLAQRAANAAGEIKRLIGDSVERVSGGSRQVSQAGQTMQDIVDAIQKVNTIIAEIASASEEQNAGIAQVGQAISSIDDVTQQNAALVEQVAAAAESLETQTAHLASEMAHFKTGDGNSHSRHASKLPTKSSHVIKKPSPIMQNKSPTPVQSSGSFSASDDWEEF